MKIRSVFAALCLIFVPSVSYAQSFSSVESCVMLKSGVESAVKQADNLSMLLTDETLTEEAYLSQLYDGIKVLTSSGEMLFQASDKYESTCKAVLTEAKKIEEVRVIYDWYLEPVKVAYQFFRRAREAAIRLNRQGDVDVFNTTMTEYDAAVMKLVSVCESDLKDTPSASTCSELSARLGDILK